MQIVTVTFYTSTNVTHSVCFKYMPQVAIAILFAVLELLDLTKATKQQALELAKS